MATEFLEIKNNATGALSAPANDTDDPVDLSLGAGEGANFPSAFPFHVSVDDEILRCTEKPSADVLRCTRAQEGTSKQAHSAGAAVELRVTAKHVADLNGAVNTIENNLEAGAEQANTTPSSFTQWGSQSGQARQVMTYNPATGLMEPAYLTAIDVLTPAQILSFLVEPDGSYPDGVNGLAMVASSGQDTPSFSMTYEGTPTAASIDIQSHTYGGARNPEVNAGDYPSSVASPFTSHLGPAINRGQAVNESVTFRLTATVDGQEKTRDVTLRYYNERMWGVSSEAAIDTQAEIDTFRTAQNKELSNSRVKTFTVTAGAGEYIYYIIREALGTPTFTVGGFEGGFSKVGDVSWQNPRGFTENYDVWRSDSAGLGQTTVEVT